MGRNRAERREFREKRLARAGRIITQVWGRSLDEWSDPHYLEKWVDNMAHCSRPCCGNPRKWYGRRTRQESTYENPRFEPE